MQVRKGYKQTEVGVIPEEWDVGNLGLFWGVTDCKHVTATFVQNGIPLASIKEVQSRFIDLANAKQTTEQYYSQLIEGGRKPLPGDLIISRNATVGETSQVAEWHPRFAMGQDVCLLRKKSPEHSTDYLQSVFQSPIIANQLANLMVGSTFKRVNVEQIRNFVVPMPLPDEQRAIASALSDVDALLTAQDKLIAKKRDIKQAAMQQLLTGKQRLPGFSGEWEVKRLADICWFQEGPGVRNYQFTKQGVKLLNGTNIVNGKVSLDTTNRYISEDEAFGGYKHFLVDDGDILIASSGVTIDKFHEKVAFASSENLPLCMNTSTIRFKADATALLDKFLYFFLQSDLFKEPIGKQATGSAQLNFGPAHLKKINVTLPPKIEEQTAISAVLSDMDAELAALEQQRDKTRALKQGMMQELLTGRIRLV